MSRQRSRSRARSLIVTATGCLAIFAGVVAVDGDAPTGMASALAFAGPPAEENARDSGAWWLDTYHIVEPRADARAGLAQAVFERLAAAVDKRGNRLPRLVIVGAPDDPFAVALPDGSVVLTRGALDFCYGPLPVNNAARQRGDLRLAFVLGHELAHLASDDFWHRSAFAEAERIRNGSGSRRRERILEPPSPQDLQLAELKADSSGVITMTMAGYSPGELFRGDADFFDHWVKQAGLGAAYDDPTHPRPARRAEFVRGQLAALVDDVDLFDFGVRLAQLGRYTDAILLLDRFRDRFAGREVLNDLGYANYQLAVKKLAACDGSPTVRFRLPVAIDDDTLASRASLRGAPSSCLESEPVRKHLAEARRFLELAKEKDPNYLPARRNLLAVELVSGNAAAAIALAEKTLEVAPGDAATLVAKGIGFYLFGVDSRLETFDMALDFLAKAEGDPRRAADAVYARAVILSERGRIAYAREAWERFLELEPHGCHADLARARLGLPAEPKPAAAPPPRPPIPLGVVGPATRVKLDRLERRPLTIGGSRIAIYRGAGLQVLQLGDAVEVVEQAASTAHPGPQPPSVAAVRVETPRGVFVRYPGVAFDMEGDRVRAVVYFAPAR